MLKDAHQTAPTVSKEGPYVIQPLVRDSLIIVTRISFNKGLFRTDKRFWAR
jgi:hypothetical protein